MMRRRRILDAHSLPVICSSQNNAKKDPETKLVSSHIGKSETLLFPRASETADSIFITAAL